MQWFDELDLDPGSPAVAMKTRALGDQSWLLADDRRSDELELKADLCRDRHGEVFMTLPGTSEAADELIGLIEACGFAVSTDPALHPLDRAGRSVQEDLCLLRRETTGWTLAAASVCFPTRWRLADKIGRSVTDVHAPIPGYRTRLAGRVDALFDRLGDRIVRRRNWFVHPDPSLFQPRPPEDGDPTIPASRCLADLVVRSERQTLRRLDGTGSIVFTIRVQQASLGEVVGSRPDMVAYLHGAPASELHHRGMHPDQVVELRLAVG